MAVFLSPIGNDQQLDANGNPLNGGTIETFLAGSTTPAATFTGYTGLIAQANPIILNSLGLPSSPIWLAGGVTLKFVIKNSNGTVLRTIDNVSGINDANLTVSEWVGSGLIPTFISTTSFSLPGDQTSTLQVSRRIRTLNASGLVYSTILTSVFGVVTTVTVKNDDLSALDPALSKIEFGVLSATNPSLPVYPVVIPQLPAFSAYQTTLQSIQNNNATKILLQTEEFDTDSAFDSVTNNRFKPTVPGYYQINGGATFSVASLIYCSVYKNGVEYKRGSQPQLGFVSSVSSLVFLNGTTDYLELFAYQSMGASVNTLPGQALVYFQGFYARRAT